MYWIKKFNKTFYNNNIPNKEIKKKLRNENEEDEDEDKEDELGFGTGMGSKKEEESKKKTLIFWKVNVVKIKKLYGAVLEKLQIRADRINSWLTTNQLSAADIKN